MLQLIGDAGAPKGGGQPEMQEWLSPQDISEMFGISTTLARRVMHSMPYFKVGKLLRVHRSSVYAELREHGGLTSVRPGSGGGKAA